MWYGSIMQRRVANGDEQTTAVPDGWQVADLPESPHREYDEDGYLFRCPVDNAPHHAIGVELHVVVDAYLRRRHGDAVFVGGELGLYPKRGQRRNIYVPDLLVSLTAGAIDAPGAPERPSYKLWLEPVPDLVLEILSPGTWRHDLERKPGEYQALGISEYWMFDPSRRWIPAALRGRVRRDGVYAEAEPKRPGAGEMPVPAQATCHWSDVLGLYLYADGDALRLHDAKTGTLETHRELSENREAAVAARDTAVEERETAVEERDTAVKERDAARAQVQALEAELAKLRRR